MKVITRSDLVKSVMYSPETGVFTRVSSGKVIGAPDRKGYLLFSVRGCPLRAHRAAWLYMTGEWPAEEIDHVNGVASDNRFCNLRECSHQQNNHNQSVRKNSKSGVKGVSWSATRKKWHAQVCLNYKIHTAGFFDNLVDAAVAVRFLRYHLHGDFAHH